MKKIYFFLLPVIFALIIANIFLVYFSIKLGDQISQFEEKTDKIKQENLLLEKELSYYSSLEFAKKIAKKLDFIENPQYSYLDKSVYAYLQNQ